MEAIGTSRISYDVTDYSIQAALGSKKGVLLPMVCFLLVVYDEKVNLH